jgi:hypothetical protein
MERKGLSQTPRFTKEEQKDGMIRESSTRSSHDLFRSRKERKALL